MKLPRFERLVNNKKKKNTPPPLFVSLYPAAAAAVQTIRKRRDLSRFFAFLNFFFSSLQHFINAFSLLSQRPKAPHKC